MRFHKICAQDFLCKISVGFNPTNQITTVGKIHDDLNPLNLYFEQNGPGPLKQEARISICRDDSADIHLAHACHLDGLSSALQAEAVLCSTTLGTRCRWMLAELYTSLIVSSSDKLWSHQAMLFRSLPRCYVLRVEVAHLSFSQKSCIVCHMTAHIVGPDPRNSRGSGDRREEFQRDTSIFVLFNVQLF
jgi:hypothetical protein